MQKNPAVTISIINYNERKFIFQAIESAVNQNYPNLEIFVTDNNSTDGTTEEIEKRIPEWKEKRRDVARRWLHSPFRAVEPKCELQKGSTQEYGANMKEDYGTSEIKYIKNNENTGFGRPHNNVIRKASGEFILLLNADIILPPDYIENVLKPFEDPKVGAVQGKLLRYDFDKNELYKSKEDPELNVIDTTGLMMLKNRRIVCIGQGQPDKGQFEKETEVFGADGAIPIYRKEALEDIKMEKLDLTHPQPPLKRGLSDSPLERGRGVLTPLAAPRSFGERGQGCVYEYFDEDFFMYKEDVDLAWRLRLYGWKAIYTPKAVAYHGRGSGDSMAKNYIDIIKERRKINIRAKYLSFKHQRLMQIKNDFPSLLFTKHFFSFIIKEIGAWAYMIIFERFLFRTLKDLYRDVPVFLKKRKVIMARKKVDAKEMERWFY